MRKLLIMSFAILIFCILPSLAQSSKYTSYKTNTILVYEVTQDGKISIKPKYCQKNAKYEKQQVLNDHVETTIYPNPAMDYVTLKINSNIEENAQIFIEDYSKNSEQIWTGKLYKGENIIQLDLTKYPKGFYLLTIENGKILTFQKLIKN